MKIPPEFVSYHKKLMSNSIADMRRIIDTLEDRMKALEENWHETVDELFKEFLEDSSGDAE